MVILSKRIVWCTQFTVMEMQSQQTYNLSLLKTSYYWMFYFNITLLLLHVSLLIMANQFPFKCHATSHSYLHANIVFSNELTKQHRLVPSILYNLQACLYIPNITILSIQTKNHLSLLPKNIILPHPHQTSPSTTQQT